MVKTVKYFAYFFFFMVMLYATFPKMNLFYKAEELLKTYKVNILNESLQNGVFSLKAEHFNIVFEGIETAHVTKAEFLLLGIYNSIDVEGIELSGIVKNFLPQKIASVHLVYSVLNPFLAKAYIQGAFGEAQLVYAFNKRQLLIRLHPSQLMLQKFSSSLQEFKKLKNGVYYYEKSL